MTGVPAGRFRVIDTFYRDRAYRLVDLVYADLPLRDKIPDTPIRLPSNPLAEPDVGTTQRHDVSFGGGMMGGMMGSGMGGGMGGILTGGTMDGRSEERRVGKERISTGRSRGSPHHNTKKRTRHSTYDGYRRSLTTNRYSACR